MTKKAKREEWLRDVHASQRNTVFPDTASNEARLWRNLLSSKRVLTTVQILGLALLFITLGGALLGLVLDGFRYPYHGSLWQLIMSRFGGYLLALAVVGVFLLVMQFVTRPRKTRL